MSSNKLPLGSGRLTSLDPSHHFNTNTQKHLSQRMMRARVAAQGFTIAVLAVGSFYNMNIKPSQQLAYGAQGRTEEDVAPHPGFSSSSSSSRRRV